MVWWGAWCRRGALGGRWRGCRLYRGGALVGHGMLEVQGVALAEEEAQEVTVAPKYRPNLRPEVACVSLNTMYLLGMQPIQHVHTADLFLKRVVL